MFVDNFFFNPVFDLDVGMPSLFVTNIRALGEELERDTQSTFLIIGLRAGFLMEYACEVYEFFHFSMICHKLAQAGRLHDEYLNFFDEQRTKYPYIALNNTSCYRRPWLDYAKTYWETVSLHHETSFNKK